MLYEKNADTDGHLYFYRYDYPISASDEYRSVPHFHNSFEVWMVEKGEVTLFMNGEWHTLCEGDIAFIDRLTPHTSARFEKENNKYRYYVVVASSAYLSSVKWLEDSTLSPIIRKKEGSEHILELLRWAYSDCDRMTKEMKHGFVTLLFGTLCAYHGAPIERNEKSSRLIVDIMIYLNEKFREKVTLDELAQRFGYERTYLSRTFNRLMGMNLREYLNRLRVNAVKSELERRPDTPIYKIAEECGFDNPNTFYRSMAKYANKAKL